MQMILPSGAFRPKTEQMLNIYHRFELPDCLLYTSDAADDSLRVDLGGRRII